MTTIGHATLDVIPSVKGLRAELEKQTGPDLDRAGVDGGTRFGSAAGKSAGSRFGSLFKSAAKASIVGAAALAAGGVKLAFDSISAASDLEESTNKVTQVFGKGAESVLKFTEGTADALGQTNNEARGAAATFGIFGNAAGLADRKNAKFAKRMTRLASDLASFNNTDPSQAVEALGAALRGESEPIRAYGVMLDEATLKAEALALGILEPVKNQSQIKSYQVAIMEGQKKYNDAVKESGKESLEALKAEASLGTARDRLKKATEGTIPPLTQQQKLLAAQSQIFKQTEVAQGDFERTSGSLANQQRRLSARFEDAKAKLGKGLLPIMTDAADFLLDKGIPAFERFADWFNKEGIPAIKKFGDKAEIVGGKVKDLVGFFNDLPTAGKIASLGSAIAGGVVVKHKLDGIFARGGIANPMFVTVTNPGIGGTTTPGAGGKGGTISRLAKGTAKALPPVLIIGGVLYEVDSMLKDAGAKHPDAKPRDFSDGVMNDGYIDFGKDWDKAKEDVITLSSKVNGLNDALFLVGNKKIRPQMDDREIVLANKRLGEFISKKVDAGQPITPYIDTSSIERALALVAQLPGAAHGVPTAGTDGGAPFVSGAGSRAGVTFTGPINVNSNNPREFVSGVDKVTRDRSRGGR